MTTKEEAVTAPDTARLWWVAMSLIPNLGKRTLDRLLARFESLEAAARADAESLRRVSGIGPVLTDAIRSLDIERVRDALAAWERDGIAVLTPVDEGYPTPLRELPDAPAVLFCRGTWQLQDAQAVALVGTRTPTAPAQHATRKLSAALAQHGWGVVSGLARGIDTLAHRAALNAGGRTLAVLGSGLNAIYPQENRALAEALCASGALFSEMHPQARPHGPALVARNRIITGLSRAVIVVEAGPRSGSLHAARFAQRQGRPVFAFDSAATGNQMLIAQGAVPLDMKRAAGKKVLDSLAQKY